MPISFLAQFRKDFKDFWGSQIFWAALVAIITCVIQVREHLISSKAIRENLLAVLGPYAAIGFLFAVGNIGRTLFIREREELQRRRRFEHRAQRREEIEKSKP